jgi:hypothetical protein
MVLLPNFRQTPLESQLPSLPQLLALPAGQVVAQQTLCTQ